MKKRKLIPILSICLIFISLVSGVLASVAWFYICNTVDLDVTGSFVEAYFHCGTGTAEDPFVITRPIHYYHLVEFYQRTTTLPSPSVHFGSDYLYFQVGYDLDDSKDGVLEVYNYNDQGVLTENDPYSQTLNMAYYSGSNALLPIGTNEVPFIGVFDGKADKGIVISNLNIHCAETVRVNGNNVNRAASDIGVFGYVADVDANSHSTIIKNTMIEDLTIDLSDVASTVASPQTHASSHAGQAYVGYIAGHVHTYNNYDGSTNPATNASPLYNVYVDKATIKGGPGVNCNYGYIGLVDTIDNGQTTATVAGEVSELISHGGHEQGDDWGGSIPFSSLNTRLFNSLKTTSTMGITSKNTSGNVITSGGPMYRYYSKTDSKVTVYRGGSGAYTYFNSNPNNSPVVYNLMGTQAQYGNTNPGTVIPLQVNDDYTVASTNTGYIMSDSVNNTNGSVRSASYKIQHIAGSLGDFAESTYTIANLYSNTYNNIVYDSSKFEVLTNAGAASSSGYSLISDSYNSSHTPQSGSFLYSYRSTKKSYETLGLERYEDARETLDEILTNASVVHGLHFYGSTSDTSTRVTSTNPYTITAKINGSNAIANYPLPHSCIDFNLKEKGLITLFAGTYYPAGSQTKADSILSLFKITRNGNNISSITQIQKIYLNPDYDSEDPASNKYMYSSNGNKPTGAGDLVFDVTGYLNSIPKTNVVCYFEIPVDAGEYAIGGVTGKEAGAYLMYLDIAASHGDDQEPTYDQENLIRDASLFTQVGFINSNTFDSSNSFVINSCFNVAYVIPAGSTKDTFSITISCVAATHDAHSYTCYVVEIINTSGNQLILNALLMDDDGDNDNEYYYMYKIKYNNGSFTEYFTSNTFTANGNAQTTSMTPTYVPQTP